ncbi:nucleotidyltransferase domain-containing protein [Clostridium sediminicola]|uniref:nucleotidyltransferase domain-containing protein n=1 Tax=Clostridium sediminicola TaxID=3114879 RepID=UPI0031F21A03
MKNVIADYQSSFNSIIEKLKKNDEILAVMVFGSMVSGDLWEDSDIDLFVIIEGYRKKIENIYTEEKNIPIHIKLISKQKFMQFHEEDLMGGFLHRMLSSSKLVFSNDYQVTERFDNGRYYPDLERQKWNLVYLGLLLKSLDVCKKYLSNDSIYSAFCESTNCMQKYSKLFVNYSGYMISKDTMRVCINLNDEFKYYAEKLLSKDKMKESIEELICYIENDIDKNLKNYTSILLSFMATKDKLLSAQEIEKDEFFRNFEIKSEHILNKLYSADIIKKSKREFKINEKMLIEENTYYL